MTQKDAADAMGLSHGGYVKKENGDRGLSKEDIQRACAVFGASAEEIMAEVESSPILVLGESGEIDPEKLASLISQTKDRIASLSELEAKNLVLALISASRRP